MFSYTTFLLIATCFVLSHQLPTSLTPTTEKHALLNPSSDHKSSEQRPLSSSFLKDDKASADIASKGPSVHHPALSVSSHNNRNEQASTPSSSRVTPIEPSKTPLTYNNPSLKVVRETEAFKAHETSSNSGSSTRSPAPSTLKKTEEQHSTVTVNKDAKNQEQNNRTPILRPATLEHHLVRREILRSPIEEPENSLVGKRIKALPAFMG